jgi:CSLREA domain-containing protein
MSGLTVVPNFDDFTQSYHQNERQFSMRTPKQAIIWLIVFTSSHLKQPRKLIRLALSIAACIALTLVFTKGLSGQSSFNPLAPGMVSWWPADGNANDTVGGNEGTLQNGATFSSGEVGQAFSFDGVNQGVLVSPGALPNIPPDGQFTVDLWFNPSNASGVHTMFQRERSYLYIEGGVIKSAVGHNATGTGKTVTVGCWTHAAVTYNNGSVNIYVNGVLAGSSTQTLEGQTGFGTSIGYNVRFNIEYFAGLIDEVQFFNRALSPIEVQNIYASGSAGQCNGPTLTVNSTADTNDGVCDATNCTLREAINAANNQAGVDTINFSVTGTINLLTPLPSINDPVTFDGPGMDQLTIQRSTSSGTPDFNIFRVTASDTVTFSGLTISNGGGVGSSTNSTGGGAIQNLGVGTVNVMRTRVAHNSANYGGGLNNYVGTLNITDSIVSENATIPPTDDPDGGSGGGVYNYAGILTVTNSTISGNHTSHGGGGIFKYQGALTIINSTISDNTAGGGGGGVHCNDAGLVNITNSTFANNTAEGGGAILQVTDVLNITNSTIVNNSVELNGGGIFNNGATVNLRNTILALNTSRRGTPNFIGTVNSLGHNLIGGTNGLSMSPQAGDQLGVSAAQLNLSALANNGGPTQTIRLNVGSIAIDAGDDCVAEAQGCLASPLTTDQRGQGFPRKSGAHVDVGAVEGASDVSVPVTTSSSSPNANAAGWNNSNVTVSLVATDESGGSGVKEITYSAGGAQSITPTTVSGASANVEITAEGQTTIAFFARDNAGNTEPGQTIVVKIDKSAPTLSCDTADGIWHASNVSIACSATETISSLADNAEATFNLVTSVANGAETANASTNSHAVCDIAGNCATAGPIAGNQIDRKGPMITVTAPTATNYLLNQAVTVQFACSDGGSGVASCTGTSANGGSLDTASVGAKTFTVNATDNVGNSAVPAKVNYTVSFGIQVLFDQTRAHKSGSTIPIKVRLIDANANVSSAGTVLHAVSVVQISSQSSPVVEDAGNANPDFDFRYDPSTGGYIFNLKTTGYQTGNYLLNFTATGDPTIYSVGFQVRQ